MKLFKLSVFIYPRVFAAIKFFCFLWLILSPFSPLHAQEEEDTYTISLTKTAENQEGKKVHEVDNKKVLAQEYTIQDGDHVWQLLRDRGLLERKNLSEILATLKKLNKSLQNLDMVHPGEKIIIPLKIAPIQGPSGAPGPVEEETVTIAELKDINFQNYTVQKDDQLIKVVRGMYQINQEDLYGKYLKLVKQLNPGIKDINKIYPGQTLRIPIYSPEVVRVPIKKMPAVKPVQQASETPSYEPNPLTHDLGRIFAEMGEEWVDSGEHFIPLKTGGQINLKAASFPIINQKNGHRVIIDLDSKLPNKMSSLIESSWNNYQVVRLTEKDPLKAALGKIINKCQFQKVYKKDEAIELGKSISMKITGDWIIKTAASASDMAFNTIVINLKETRVPDTPKTLRDYISGFGVKVIDYPPNPDATSVWTDKVEAIKAGNTPGSLVKTILEMTGQTFSADMELPVYQDREADIKMVIIADFFFKINGQSAVIDFTGMDPDVVSLLNEQGYKVLSLANEKDPTNLVSRVCEFTGRPTERGPHDFKATPADDSKNIRLTLPGIIFHDSANEKILATPLTLPEEINAFLYHKGYKVLYIYFS